MCIMSRRIPRRARSCRTRRLTEEDEKRRTSPFGTFPLNDEGAWLMPYEMLINPPSVAFTGAALAVEGRQAASRQAGSARQGLCRAPALSSLQPDDRPHQRHNAELLRHHDHPAAEDRRPAAPAYFGGDQLLFPRLRALDRRGQSLSLEGRRSDAVRAGLGGAQPRLATTITSMS